MTLCLSPTPVPGQPIADTMHGPIVNETYEFLQSDGTPVGTIMSQRAASRRTFTAGTGSRNIEYGDCGRNRRLLRRTRPNWQPNATQGLSQSGVSSTRSITEDPAKRRLNGGSRHVHLVRNPVVPAGDRHDSRADRLLPTRTTFRWSAPSKPPPLGRSYRCLPPGSDRRVRGLILGQPFPSDPPAVVNSPLEVTLNGKPAEVLGAVGLPGTVDGYQVNFRVPPDLGKGPASIQISAAWVPGAAVSIPVQ